eukprot:jgi/Mesvir1/23307/Mv21003-RA.1
MAEEPLYTLRRTPADEDAPSNPASQHAAHAAPGRAPSGPVSQHAAFAAPDIFGAPRPTGSRQSAARASARARNGRRVGTGRGYKSGPRTEFGANRTALRSLSPATPYLTRNPRPRAYHNKMQTNQNPPVFCYYAQHGLTQLADPDLVYTVEGWVDIKTYDFERHMPPFDETGEAYLSKPGRFPCGIIPRYPWYYKDAPAKALKVEGHFVSVNPPWYYDVRTRQWRDQAPEPAPAGETIYDSANHLDGCPHKTGVRSTTKPAGECECKEVWRRALEARERSLACEPLLFRPTAAYAQCQAP